MAPNTEAQTPQTPQTPSDLTDGEGESAAGARRGPFRLAGRVLAGLVVAASFTIWIYAFSGSADRDAPDLLDDPSFSVSAEKICAAALADTDAMPNALDAIDGPDRAKQIRNTTARFETMLDELDPLVRGSDRDVEIASGWLSDWRVLVQDRYRYADAIAVDEQAQFLVTDVGVSERLDRRLTRLANTNAMPSCAAPGDVG